LNNPLEVEKEQDRADKSTTTQKQTDSEQGTKHSTLYLGILFLFNVKAQVFSFLPQRNRPRLQNVALKIAPPDEPHRDLFSSN